MISGAKVIENALEEGNPIVINYKYDNLAMASDQKGKSYGKVAAGLVGAMVGLYPAKALVSMADFALNGGRSEPPKNPNLQLQNHGVSGGQKSRSPGGVSGGRGR